MDLMKIFIYSTYPFFYNHMFFLKSKVKHTGVDITSFFHDAKSPLTKHEKCFWKRLMKLVKHLSCSLLQKKFSAKKSTLVV